MNGHGSSVVSRLRIFYVRLNVSPLVARYDAPNQVSEFMSNLMSRYVLSKWPICHYAMGGNAARKVPESLLLSLTLVTCNSELNYPLQLKSLPAHNQHLFNSLP